MRSIPQEIIDALDDGVFRPVFFVEIGFDEPMLFCSLTDDFTIGTKTYIGRGNLGSISSHSENTDLDPQQIEAMISGISDENLGSAGSTNYINRTCTIHVGMLSDQGELLGNDTMLYFRGKTDDLKFIYGDASQIIITIRDRLADWSRQKLERNMNSDHQAKYPGDKFFEFVNQVTDKKIIWPKGEFYE
tara:strand:- start:4094 stop:4660 length:567 start_codon:yes stop_codon:yes gene_type:complete